MTYATKVIPDALLQDATRGLSTYLNGLTDDVVAVFHVSAIGTVILTRTPKE